MDTGRTEPADSLSSNNRAEPIRKSSGRTLYMRFCASCHGRDLSGDPPRIPSLQQVGQRRSKESIHRIIQRGKNIMPPFDFLSPPQQKAIVSYLVGEFDTEVEDVELPPARLG